VKNISGSTVLGDRRLVLILDAVGIIKTASELSSVERRRTQADDDAQEGKAKQRILVAEDSITSRLLLKNILESAGYEVNTAYDGADAFEQLLIGDYDLLVSDVDMPRMNGFILTEKVKRDKKLTDLPVVLVTSLESHEDRERGIDVGASAYIVKKSFDQSNLLEIVSRLI
ncbi:MAG: response regulator, partial [Bacteroidota bacterium]